MFTTKVKDISRKTTGKLIIKEYPTGSAHSGHFRALLNELKLKRQFEPDIILDNLPHETYMGKDAQLDAAIELLKKQISEDPRDVPKVPNYPDKSFNN